jgi:threonine dehydratase
VRFLFREANLPAEPSGAVTTAAILSGKLKVTGPTVAVVSGGNVDPDRFQQLVQ